VADLRFNDPENQKDDFLTAAELAEWLKVRKNTIYMWVSRREIPFVKLPGNTTRFRKRKIEAWLNKRLCQGKGAGRGIYLDAA